MIPRASRPSNWSYPLSFQQEWLWLDAQLAPESALYNNPLGIHLSGPLDVGAFKRAVAELASRHEALRTRLHRRGGQVVQTYTRVVSKDRRTSSIETKA